MTEDSWDPQAFPLWYGSAPMNHILKVAGPSTVLVRGEGSWLIDRSGRRFLDGRAGISNVMLGYSRTDIVDAMHQQALDLPFVCTLRYEHPAAVTVDCARALVDAAPASLTRARFTHTGSGAVESALLMARRYHGNLGRTGRTEIVALLGSYHGSTLMTMAAGGQPMLHDFFAPMPEGFQHVAPPDIMTCLCCTGAADAVPTCADAVLARVAEIGYDRVAAILVEPIKGLSGIPLPSHYLQALRQLCDEQDILLIFDEVFSGFGRTGPLFAAEISGVDPDIMCLAKGITAGYATLGAVLANDKVYHTFDQPGRQYFPHGNSTDAHPVACAAALTTLRAYQAEDVLARGRRLGDRINARLTERLRQCATVRRVRNVGGFVAVELVTPDGKPASMDLMRHLQAKCHERGVLIDYTPYIVMLVPPLTTPDEDQDRLADVIADCVAKLTEDDIDNSALRPPSVSGRR